MSAMIERVALALHSHYRVVGINKFEEMAERNKEYWRSGAKAAIAAMRDPTGAMYIAGANAIPGDANTMEILIDYLGVAWRAQIDAALRDDKT